MKRDNILIYRMGSLGDTIMALPAFHGIRRSFSDAEISLLTNQPISTKAAPVMSILENTGLVDCVIPYPALTRNIKVLSTLRKTIASHHFSAAIYLMPSRGLLSALRDWLFFKACGIRRIYGIPWGSQDKKSLAEREWEAQTNARRVSAFVKVDLNDDQNWDLRFTPTEVAHARDLLSPLRGEPFIALSLGTKAPVKDWEDPNWKSLLALLAQSLSPLPALVALGAQEESERCHQLLTHWSGVTLNLCGNASPRVSAAILKEAIVFVGHDSGPMHLAAAVGTPCVAVFSSRNLPGRWFPRGGSKNRLFYTDVPCKGCGLVECHEFHKKCILSIQPSDVAQAVTELYFQGRS